MATMDGTVPRPDATTSVRVRLTRYASFTALTIGASSTPSQTRSHTPW
jgi:hypothetical protein